MKTIALIAVLAWAGPALAQGTGPGAARPRSRSSG